MWQLLDGRGLDAVVETIVSEFEVDTERAAGDVRRFVEQLSSLGALQIKRRAPKP
ncbi:MAG: PqqD family protein [Polyangiaceae bacterium]